MKRTVASTITALAIAVGGVIAAPAAHALTTSDIDTSALYPYTVDTDVLYALPDANNNHSVNVIFRHNQMADEPAFNSPAGYVLNASLSTPNCSSFSDSSTSNITWSTDSIDFPDQFLVANIDLAGWDCDWANEPSMIISGSFYQRIIDFNSFSLPTDAYLSSTHIAGNVMTMNFAGLDPAHSALSGSLTSFSTDSTTYSGLNPAITIQELHDTNGANTLASITLDFSADPNLPLGFVLATQQMHFLNGGLRTVNTMIIDPSVPAYLENASGLTVNGISQEIAQSGLYAGQIIVNFDLTNNTSDVRSLGIMASLSNDGSSAIAYNPYYLYLPGSSHTIQLVVPASRTYGNGEYFNLSAYDSGIALENSFDPSPLSATISANNLLSFEGITYEIVHPENGDPFQRVYAQVSNTTSTVVKLTLDTVRAGQIALSGTAQETVILPFTPTQQIVLGDFAPAESFGHFNLALSDATANTESVLPSVFNTDYSTGTDWPGEMATHGLYAHSINDTDSANFWQDQTTGETTMTAGTFRYDSGPASVFLKYDNVKLNGSADGVTLRPLSSRINFSQNGYGQITSNEIATIDAAHSFGINPANMSYTLSTAHALDWSGVISAFGSVGVTAQLGHFDYTDDGIKISISASPRTNQTIPFHVGTVTFNGVAITPPPAEEQVSSLTQSNPWTVVQLGTISYSALFDPTSTGALSTEIRTATTFDTTDVAAALASANLELHGPIMLTEQQDGTFTGSAQFCSINGAVAATYTMHSSGYLDTDTNESATANIESTITVHPYLDDCTARTDMFILPIGADQWHNYKLSLSIEQYVESQIVFSNPSTELSVVDIDSFDDNGDGTFCIPIHVQATTQDEIYGNIDFTLSDENGPIVETLSDSHVWINSQGWNECAFHVPNSYRAGLTLTFGVSFRAGNPSRITNAIEHGEALNVSMNTFVDFNEENNSTSAPWWAENNSSHNILAIVYLELHNGAGNVVAYDISQRLVVPGGIIYSELVDPADGADDTTYTVTGSITTITSDTLPGDIALWKIQDEIDFSHGMTETTTLMHLVVSSNGTLRGLNAQLSVWDRQNKIGSISRKILVPAAGNSDSTISVSTPYDPKGHDLRVEGTMTPTALSTFNVKGIKIPKGSALTPSLTRANVNFTSDLQTSTAVVKILAPWAKKMPTYALTGLKINGKAVNALPVTSPKCTSGIKTIKKKKFCTVDLPIPDIAGDIRVGSNTTITGLLVKRALPVVSGKVTCQCDISGTVLVGISPEQIQYNPKTKTSYVYYTVSHIDLNEHYVSAPTASLKYTVKVGKKLVTKTVRSTAGGANVFLVKKVQLFKVVGVDLRTATKLVFSGKVHLED